MSLLRTYEPAVSCTDGPQDGAKALMAWALGAWADKGLRNLGIYNCRPIRGTTNTTSLHGEGRACDLGFPVGDPDADVLCQLLIDHSAELGVQCVIYERKIWSGARPDEGRRPYGGTNPHTDHLHVELSWQAARTLTAEAIEAVLGGATVVISAGEYEPKGPRLLRKGDRGFDVGVWQRELNRMGYTADVDDIFGDETRKATVAFQHAAGIEEDGVVGPATRAKASQVPGFPGLTRPGQGSRRAPNAVTRAYQQVLRNRGWRKMAVDGIHRDGTTAIIKAFQVEKRLDRDGVGGRDVWAAAHTRDGAVR